MFYHDRFGFIHPPCTARTSLVTSNAGTYYFRQAFTLPSQILDGPVTGILAAVIGDGGVFYLNGTEILRTNVPTGPLTHASRALGPGFYSSCATNQINVTGLLRETNVLAVEVHQYRPTDSEIVFDAALSLIYSTTPQLTNHEPAGEVHLRYADLGPGDLRLYWTNGMGYALEYVNALADQWREVQPPSTNVLVNKTGGTRFYRLNKRH